MEQTLTFSRAKLADYLVCRRRFQLRYLERRPWPVAPLAGLAEEAQTLGQHFHLRLQRYFLGMQPVEEAGGNPQLLAWWQRFVNQGPALPGGQRFAEYSLTVPISQSQLTGRFDLFIFGEDGVSIFDWKTDARPRPVEVLSQDLQTRLYLALMVEGSRAWGELIEAERVQLTYWFANDPKATITFGYSQVQHQRNWTEIKGLVGMIESQLANQVDWPLTDDLANCEHCAYPAYCGRPVTVLDSFSWLDEIPPAQLEPELP